MAMTSNAAALVQPQAPMAGLLLGHPGLSALARRMTTPVSTARIASHRVGRPLLPVFHLLAMSAGIERNADITTSPRAAVSSNQRATDRPHSASTGEPSNDGASPHAAGDPDDLHRLVVEHSDAIFRLALSVVRDRALAEDVAQEALVKAWLALPTFRGDSSIRSWLLRITHNTAISTLRRRRAVVVDPHDLPERRRGVVPSVESRVQGHVVMDEFVEALDTLDELSRSIVVLRELEGLSYEEISEVLAIPMPTVKTRLLRARRRLGNVLRDWA